MSPPRLGILRPSRCTAIGKVLLGALPEQELETYLRCGPFEAFTSNTITRPAALREEVRRVAASGVGCDDAEFSAEMRCYAARVHDYMQQAVAALGISGPVWRVTPKNVPRLRG